MTRLFYAGEVSGFGFLKSGRLILNWQVKISVSANRKNPKPEIQNSKTFFSGIILSPSIDNYYRNIQIMKKNKDQPSHPHTPAEKRKQDSGNELTIQPDTKQTQKGYNEKNPGQPQGAFTADSNSKKS